MSPITATAAPAATQRSCWRSTPGRTGTAGPRRAGRPAGRRRGGPGRHGHALGQLPRRPGWPSGLSNGTTVSVVGPGSGTRPPNMPGTAAATPSGDRPPSGTSRAGRVMPGRWPAPRRHLGHGLSLAARGRGAVAGELVDPGPGDDQAPGERRGGVQPADRVGRPPQGQDQPDGRVPEREAHGEQGAVEQDLGGERPGDQQRDHQPGGAAPWSPPQRPGGRVLGRWFGVTLSSAVGSSSPRIPARRHGIVTDPQRPPAAQAQSSSAIRLAARAAPSVSTGR